MNCRIFDDEYGKRLYEDMKASYSFLNYPIKSNIDNPLEYIDKIKDWDYILLDNWFPVVWGWDEALWDVFLWKYIELWLKCNIICISDFGKSLTDKFSNWFEVNNRWDIVGRCPSKSIKDIKKYLILS